MQRLILPLVQERVTLAKIVLLALLYIVFGKLGLELAVPPGYATLLWPPSGIALGMLLMHGRNLWPGILAGSFLLNSWIADAWPWASSIPWNSLLTALCIAIGSTLQALIGWYVIKRYFGLPLHFSRLRQIWLLLLFYGPLTCIVAPSIGIASLHFIKGIPVGMLGNNWLSWWGGDTFGVIIFLPLMLLAPGTSTRLRWNNTLVNSLPFVYMIAVIVPLGLTFYGWKVLSEQNYAQSMDEFRSATETSESALTSRIESYAYALIGGLGYFQNTPHLTRDSWNQYAEALSIATKFPGMNGIGVIYPIPNNELMAFEHAARHDGAAHFSIHPALSEGPHYVIKYTYPEAENQAAIGLNIAFEQHRRVAAEAARDTGATTIAQKITLVQDKTHSPGFLILQPVYKKDMPVLTVEQRRDAFKGWIYAPVIARNLFDGVKGLRSTQVSLKVYDGKEEAPEKLIYATDRKSSTMPNFTLRKHIRIMQQDWLLVWESTPAFDSQEHRKNNNALFILIGGICFTGLFGLLLSLFSIHNQQYTSNQAPGYAIPAAVLLITLAASGILYQQVHKRELQYLRELTQSQLKQSIATLSIDAGNYITALQRMADRWIVAHGTPYSLWLSDTTRYIHDLAALRTVTWSDRDGIVRWATPLKALKKYIGMRIDSGTERRTLLAKLKPGSRYIVSMPRDYNEVGYTGVAVYLPLTAHAKPDGMLIATISLDTLFSERFSARALGATHGIFVRYNNRLVYHSGFADEKLDWKNEQHSSFAIGNRVFTLQLVPSIEYTRAQMGYLSRTLLAAGVIIAILFSLTVRTIMLVRARSVSLRLAMEAAETATRAKSDFLSNISHEIRTPLNGILATAQLLEVTPLNEKQKHYLDIVRTSGEALLLLLNDVLDLSKIEMRQLELHPHPYNLRMTTTHVVELFSSAARQKSLEFHFTFDPALPEWVIGDSARYSQILGNLIGNAVKYTQTGSITVAGTHSGSAEHPMLRIEVRDTGIGIPPDTLPTVFDRFVQAHKHAKIQGTGLGLAICKSLVEMMGGTIGVLSEENKGSCFWFLLPLAPHRDTARQEKTSRTAKAGGLTGLHVLLAEDVEFNREIIRDMLEFLGCMVSSVANGAEAVDFLQTQHCDLVLMDCNMPVLNGYDATRALRQTHPDLPIIAISAHAFAQDVELCYAAGMNDYVQKPVQMTELEHCLRKWASAFSSSHIPSAEAVTVDTPYPDWLPRDPKRAHTLLGMMQRDIVRLSEDIQTGFTEHDAEEIAGAAHALKSIALQAGHLALHDTARELEIAGREAQWERMRPVLTTLLEHYETLYSELVELEKQIGTPESQTVSRRAD